MFLCTVLLTFLQVQHKLTNKMSKELSEDQYYNSTTKQYYPFGIAFNFAQKEVLINILWGLLDMKYI